MTGRVDGKVAFVSGAARGQGRSHCLRLAEEGADIMALDLCGQIDSVGYPLASREDLNETIRGVQNLGRRIVWSVTDVRDSAAVQAALDGGVREPSRLNIVAANAGIFSVFAAPSLPDDAWRDMLDVNLTGVWNTCRASLPHLRRGASIVLTSSTAGLRPIMNMTHYTLAKHGVVGLMKNLALELAPQFIRVNSVHPTTVHTEMIHNPMLYSLFAPDLQNPTREAVGERFRDVNLLPVDAIEPIDVSNALLFLASDEARYITGVALPVDAGAVIR